MADTKEDTDVQDDSSPSSDEKEESDNSESDESDNSESDEDAVESDDDSDSDKDKNFSELRKTKQRLEKENRELRQKLEEEGEDRSLDLGGEDQEEKKEQKDPLKAVFERDVRDATREWNKENEATAEEWAQVRKRITLTGEETRSEIYDKIDEVYNTLPDVRKRREKQLIEKGKKEAMGQFQDSELDIGGGGDVDLGEGKSPRFTPKEKAWLDGMNVPKEERKKIDKDADPSEETLGKEATKKFFVPGG